MFVTDIIPDSIDIDNFFKFCQERHNIYLRRQNGIQPPWTFDPILGKYKFTNIFRELDKTTVWFRENVREQYRDNILLATIVFRLFNRIETGEVIFPDVFDEFLKTKDTNIIKNAIEKAYPKGPYVTGAYQPIMAKGLKIQDGVLEVINQITNHTIPFVIERNYCSSLTEIEYFLQVYPQSLESVSKYLQIYNHIGSFIAYEIVTDLRHTNLLKNAPDIMTWANPGPGSTAGLNRIWKRLPTFKQPRQKFIVEMQFLLENSRNSENLIGFPWMELRDIEHGLCEFDKYERARLKEPKKMRGVYFK
jgi:hypothetical protein